MTKTNIIIAGLNPKLFTVKRLMFEAAKLKHSTTYINPYQFQIPFLKPKLQKGIFFHRTTGVNYDDFDLVVAKHHEVLGMKVTNPLLGLKLFRSKDQHALFFREFKLPHIPSILYRGAMSEELSENISSLSLNNKYILKMSRGNQGIGVNFLEGHQSLLSVLETFHAMRDQRFLIQPYIEHKKEWRLFIIKGKVQACIEKTLSKDDFRGNAKRSSGKSIKKIPKDLEELALRAFFHSGLDYAGVDILLSDKGEFLILEINPIPGFEQAEELSKHNIARELLIGL